MIFKLVDEGNKLDLPMMALLPKLVTQDIYEEHWKEICLSNWSVDFKQIKKQIASRCLNVLKRMIVNNVL